MIADYAAYIAIPLLIILAVQELVLWRHARGILTGRTVWPYIRRFDRAEVVMLGRVAVANIIIAAVLVALFTLRCAQV